MGKPVFTSRLLRGSFLMLVIGILVVLVCSQRITSYSYTAYYFRHFTPSPLAVLRWAEGRLPYESLFTLRHAHVAKARRRLEELGRTTAHNNTAWDRPSNDSYYHCTEADWARPSAADTNGYVLVSLDGGLNQQIFEIIDSIVVARAMNATWVVPELQFDAFWKDKSDFADVFDLDHFRSTLAADVRIVTAEELPPKVRGNQEWLPCLRDAQPEDYVKKMVPKLGKDKVLYFSSFWNSISRNLPPEFEKLKCRAKFEALRINPRIRAAGDKVISRLRQRSSRRFVALHLRFEEDMLAYSNCCYECDKEERTRFKAMRKERDWIEGNGFTRAQLMQKGSCPPYPEEVASWLQALGFGPETLVYLSSGKIYHSERFFGPFLQMFPLTFSKMDVLSKEEIEPLHDKNNQLAALDLYVMINADVAATSYHGAMRYAVEGERTWHNFRTTYSLPNWSQHRWDVSKWDAYTNHVQESTTRGGPKSRNRSFVEVTYNPVDPCMCREEGVGPKDVTNGGDGPGVGSNNATRGRDGGRE